MVCNDVEVTTEDKKSKLMMVTTPYIREKVVYYASNPDEKIELGDMIVSATCSIMVLTLRFRWTLFHIYY